MRDTKQYPGCSTVKHLMVVEDDVLFRKSIQLTLLKQGFQVSMARNGREALDMVSGWKTKSEFPDLLVTDIQMPGLDGFGLLEELERRNIIIPAMAITAYGDKETLVKLMRNNVYDYLDKPFTPDEFLTRIDSICRKIDQGKQMPASVECSYCDTTIRNGLVNESDNELDTELDKERKKMETRRLQARKMEALGTLAGGIAHDFNNVLSAIIGFTELALRELPESSSPREKMTRVHEAAERASDLVRQILTFSRADSDEYSPFAVGPVVKEAMRFLRSSLPTTIDIKQDISSRLPLITGNPTQIHQVLMNLATNALHAMERTGGRLEVSLSEARFVQGAPGTGKSGSGAFLELRIRDTGTGMDKKTVSRIFEPFFTTKDIGKGTGMGLAVVHGIVQAHRGTIKVYSEPGKGTVFMIYFPAFRGDVEEKDIKVDCPPSTGNEHILVVDDEPDLVLIYTELLESLGYQVEAAATPAEALKMFKSDPGRFDLVVTDQTMPRMTGIQLGKEIAAIRAGVPVVLCSGFGDAVPRAEAEAANIKYQYRKPVRCEEFAAVIRKVINDSCNHKHAQPAGRQRK